MIDAVVVGGGVVGAAIAYELSHYDLDVVLLEKEEELSFGVSKANSGIIHPGTQNSPQSLKGRLCVEGNHLVRRMSEPLGLDFKEVGELIVAFDEAETSQLWELKEEAEALGVPGLEVVPRGWLRDNEPNLNREAVAALYAPSAGIISPYRFVYALAGSAVLNGVELRTSSRVEWIERVAGEPPPARSHFVVGTSSGELETRFVVNCAGLHADSVASMVCAPQFRIRPRKGEEYILDKKRRYVTKHLLFPVPTPESQGILVTRTSDGNPMIGPTAYEVEDKEDLSTTDEGLRMVLAVAQKLVPTIDKVDIIAYFAGLRPVVEEDFFIRHDDRVPGFVNVAGIQSPGLTAAPAIGRYVVDLLHGAGLELKRKRGVRRLDSRSSHLFSMPLKEAKRLVGKDAKS
ncbi:MAG: NAD(P)/FAD-dependent oxidoreductase, partial [Dehalococcoidia bacterium]|nr:NAD(P)/FAD-dependent oxidoreductase [Dehalococcoidia bacterium]